MKKLVFCFFLFTSLLPPLCGQQRWKVAGVPASTAFSFAEKHLLASDGAGGAIVAWMDNGRLGYGLYAQRLNSRGAKLWGDRGIAVLTGDTAGEFAMVADGKGGVIFAWRDIRFNNDDIFAQRINGSGIKLWGARGRAVCVENHVQYSPMLAADGSGGAIFAWHDFRIASTTDIFAQRLDAGGQRRWAADGVPVCTAANVDNLGAVISDGAAGAIFVWEDYRLGSNRDIYAQRVNGAGTMLWPADGIAVCSDPAGQGLPKAVGYGANGAIVIWSDMRSGQADIYMQRIDADGIGVWAANGIPVAVRSNDQYSAALAGDGSGGAIVVWVESLYHDSSYHDLYAQRVDPTGNPLWTAAGVPVCVASGDQAGLSLVADMSGGAIITWVDLGFVNKIYASRLNSLGGPQWGDNGVLLALNNENQSQARLVPDGRGGAIVAWQNVGSVISAIYAQRLSPYYFVNFIAGEGGRIDGNLSQKIFSGANSTLVEALAKPGYRFRDWSGTGGFYATVNPLRIKNVREDMTIRANFVKKIAIAGFPGGSRD